jgi:hypothetical protein
MKRKSFTSGTPVLLGSVTTRSPKTCGVNNLLRTHRLVRRIEDGRVQVGCVVFGARLIDWTVSAITSYPYPYPYPYPCLSVFICGQYSFIPQIDRHIPAPYYHQKHGEHLAVPQVILGEAFGQRSQ